MTDHLSRALSAFRSGGMVVVVDDHSRENEGDIFVAGEHTTPESIAFLLQHTSGFVCVAASAQICDRLELPQMVTDNTEAHGTAFTVTVDLRGATTTGISAYDRAATINGVADFATDSADLLRPGHIHVLRARAGGVLERRGHTEAAVDLARLAGLNQAVTICEIVSSDKLRMAKGDELVEFARRHRLPLLSVTDVAEAAALDLSSTAAPQQTAGSSTR